MATKIGTTKNNVLFNGMPPIPSATPILFDRAFAYRTQFTIKNGSAIIAITDTQ